MGSAMKTILPLAATAIGAYFGGPLLGSAMGSAAAGTAVGAAAGGMLGSALAGPPEAPTVNIPALPAPTAAPTMAGPEAQAVKTQSISAQMARRGRAASILTQGVDNSGTKLGGS